ncbi:MAG: hypothetical protein ACRDQ7_11425 [Haloechinothrix sp.]
MKRVSRLVVLAAAVCLPLGAALGSYALIDAPEPPGAPPAVHIGGTDGRPDPGAEPTDDRFGTRTPGQPPSTTRVPQLPPIGDDDDLSDEDDLPDDDSPDDEDDDDD